MAEDLDIRSSGAAAIDTASLRAAADAARAVAARLRALDAPLASAAERVAAVPRLKAARDAHDELSREARRIGRLAEDANALARALERAADLYELVEVHALWSSRQDGAHPASVAALEGRTQRLGERLWGISETEEVFLMLAQTIPYEVGATGDTGAALRRQAMWGAGMIGGAVAGPLGFGLIAALQIGASRAATVRAEAARLPPHPAPDAPPGAVSVARLGRATATPVSGFATAAARITSRDGARVRLERYTMPSGDREWAVYITGTQSAAFGGADPFDMTSNIALYDGMSSGSSAAVRAALREAGVVPGEPIHAFAHSQGAMIAESLAQDADFDVRTLVTFGAPTTGPLPSDVTAVVVRHTDDPVAALAGPLPIAGRGAGDGFVVQRLADPLPGVHDITMPAHGLDAYGRTAEMIDASRDPRALAMRPLWERLAGAESVSAITYGAERQSR